MDNVCTTSGACLASPILFFLPDSSKLSATRSTLAPNPSAICALLVLHNSTECTHAKINLTRPRSCETEKPPSSKIDAPRCWRCRCSDLRPVGLHTYACRACGRSKQIRWREEVAESLGIELDPDTDYPLRRLLPMGEPRKGRENSVLLQNHPDSLQILSVQAVGDHGVVSGGTGLRKYLHYP